MYDNAGRLQKIDYPTGVDTTFSYDAASRLVQMVDATGTTTWGYNAADQVTSLAQPAGTITYEYDSNARLWKMHQPGSLTTTYTYDFAWRLKTITNGFGELTTFDYDDASRVIKKTFANQTYETYSYDARSRVEWIRLFNSSNQQLSSHGYTYDPASNVLTRTDNGVTTTFGYDDIGQLTSESRTGYSATYSYDKNGNRLTRSVNGVTEVYAYDDADKLLNIKVNGVVVKSFSYDLAGRTTGITDAGGTTSLVYDYEDRVTSISRPGMTTNTFAYNGFGARVGKTDGGGTTTYLRSGTSVVAPVVSVSGAESATYTPGISERRGSDSRFYHGDIKNFVEQTDSSGQIVSSRQYDAFGNLVSSSGTWNGPFAYGGRFGYQTDGDTSLHLLGHRYYNSTTGRFLSRDPIKDGRNWYGYCDDNPLNRVDPLGLDSSIVDMGSDAAVGFGTGILVGDIKYQRGEDTIRWIAPGGGRGGSRIIHFDHPHGDLDYPHLNSNLYPRVDHVRIPQWVKDLATPKNLRFVGRGLVAVGVAVDIVDIATSPPDERPSKIGGLIGGLAGGAAGAAIGSAILPGVGTVIGGLVGTIVGGLGGAAAGKQF